jgi:hypothetical protein
LHKEKKMKVFKILLTLAVMGLTIYSCTESTEQQAGQIDSISTVHVDSISTVHVDSTSYCVDSCASKADTAKK